MTVAVNHTIYNMNPTIYCIENTKNNKKYIGSTKSINRRWYIHKYLLKKQKHANIHLQSAWNKYGEAAFVFSILETNIEANLLLEKEDYYIKKYNTLNREVGYNIAADTTSPMNGRKHSDASKEKMREAKLGAKNNFYGRKHNEQTINKIREQKIGKKLTPEHKEKIIKTIAKSGEQNINAKLTKEKVHLIREEFKNTVMYKGFIKYLALKFNVSRDTIRRVVRNKLWKEETK